MTAGARSVLSRRARWIWLALATFAVLAVDRLWQAPQGLHATYFVGPDWQGGPATATYVDELPVTDTLIRRRPDFATQPFSVEWRGFLVASRSGTYTFAVTSDDGAALYVRGELVVDNPGRHAPLEARGTVALEAGAHPVFIRYFQDGGGATFVTRWAREGSALTPLRTSVLLTEPVSVRWVFGRRLVDLAVQAVVLAWGVLLLAAAGVRWRGSLQHWLRERRERVDPVLVAVLVLSVALNVWGVWWALPNTRGWAPDELVPADVLDALEARFSNGWHGKYPPLHYAVLSMAYTPMLLLSWVTGLDLRAPGPYQVLFYVGRFTSIGFAAGIVSLVYLCGRELYGRTGAAYAALVAALMAPFVYYGKTTNLEAPYLFWFMASLLSYVRILKRHAMADYLWFAVAATLAVSTKDQAYGLFAATPVAILVARWRRGLPIIDRTTSTAALAAVVTFIVAENLIFNFDGFLAHVEVITGPASSSYQMFPGTVRGQVDMARLALRELAFVFGWPMMGVVTIALVWGCVRASTTPSLAWLLVPAISYYATFLGVVLYFYDRFLLPMALVLAIGAGAWLERFTAPAVSRRGARLAAVGAVFIYTLLYAGMVDYVLARDSRIVVSNWVRARIAPGDLVGARGPLEYFLLAEGFQAVSVESVGHVDAVRPAFVVLNADHIAVLAPGHRTRAMRDYLASEASGYRFVMRYRTPSLPLPGRHPDLGPVARSPELSSLGQLNPPLDVFVRADVAARASR